MIITILKGRIHLLVGLAISAGLVADTALAQVVIEQEDEDGNRKSMVITRKGGPGGMHAYGEHCEGEDECRIEVKVIDGERIVVVNGDTVETDDEHAFAPMPHDYSGMMGRHHRGPVFWDDDDHSGFIFMDGNGHRPELERMRRRILSGDKPDKALMRMERDAHDLARRARQAEGDDLEDIEGQLDRKLADIFDYKNAKQKKAVERAEERLAEMRERQEKRASARDQIIEQRKQRLLGHENYMDW